MIENSTAIRNRYIAPIAAKAVYVLAISLPTKIPFFRQLIAVADIDKIKHKLVKNSKPIIPYVIKPRTIPANPRVIKITQISNPAI